jgi:RNA polymerase sigma-70 factor (ECF subfamily)
VPSTSVRDSAPPVPSATQYGQRLPEVHVLVDRFRAGDQDAFAALYRRYQPRVFAYVLSRVRNTHLAEDLTADTMAKILVALPQLQVRGEDLGGWMTTVARNVITDHVRRASVRPVTAPLPQADLGLLADEISAEDAVVQRDQWTRLIAAVNALSPRQRAVVVHRLLLERSGPQTAATLGCHEMNVKHLLRRARRRLAELLPQEVAVK